ncbi:MAG: GNAT family N-acetyltransferase [Candidatus Omnitrophica bacterium]|nr:GNAT family N-acetyltransferase [Candidatus Omnitrophota bacterium]
MPKITCQIIDSVGKIPREDWDRLFGDITEGYEFYKVLEESRLEEFTFYYLILYWDQRIILIAPLFIADFNLDIAVEGRLERVISCVRRFLPRFLTTRTLFCGSPFGEQGIIGIDKSMESDFEIAGEFFKNIDMFSRQKKTPLFMFKDFTQADLEFLELFRGYGLFRVNSFPCAIAELNFGSFEEYLKSLGHSTRKGLRRKIKEASGGGGVIIKAVDRADGAIDDIYRLYLNTHHGGTTKFERLTKEFFLSVSRNMQPHTKFFLYYVDGELGAFNLVFIYKDLFIDKFIGFDYDISNRSHLYFISWCNNAEWCIKNGVRSYTSGQTDYHAKIKLGSKLSRRYAYLRHRNNIANILLKALVLILKPENYDADILINKHA